MSKTKTGANAQFTSAGKGLTVIGKHCYGYSGLVEVEGSEKECLLFQTGKEYIVGDAQICYFQTGETDNIKFMISFNNIEVQTVQITDSTAYTPYEKIKLIIPPLTLVKITGKNVSSGGTRDIGVSFTGRVYSG